MIYNHRLILSCTWDMRDYIDWVLYASPLLSIRNGTSEFQLSTWTLKIKTTFPSPHLFAHWCGQWAQFWPADYGRKGYIELLRNILKRGIVHFPSAWWLDFGQSPRSLQSHLEPCGLKYLSQKGRAAWWKEPGFLMICATAIGVKNCLHPNYFCFSSCFASCLSHLGC